MRQSSNLNFAVIGLGRYGSALARRLEALGHTVLGVDSDANRVRAIADDITMAVIADATDENALQELDIGSFDTVIVTLGENFGATAHVAASVKDMGVATVIARGASVRDRNILLRIGVDEVVMPLEEAGERLANRLSLPGVMTTLKLSETYTVAELAVSAGLARRTVRDLEARDVTAVMLQRADELTVAPVAETVLQEGDLLFVVGPQQAIVALARAHA